VSEHLKFTVEDGIATITLNRPEKLNAFTDEMLERWLIVLEECRTDEAVRVIIMTGTGRAFTTGGDVDGFAASAAQTAAGIKRRLTHGVQRLPRKLAEIDKPVIAALNGVATGGGLDIALACDLRFAAESARFAETYAKLGLIPGAGGAYFLPRLIGMPRALAMFWTGDFVDAREAERIGLVDRIFPDAELMDRTRDFARRVAESAPLAVQMIKRVMRAGLDQTLDAALEQVASNMPVVRSSDDHAEAVRAFKEKRKPVFKGR
jgi:2-(1,2-epoxy-1,2-dihydrophenyl)acetyl-CoA isomerase